MVESSRLPLKNFRWNRSGLVRMLEDESGNHRHIAGIGLGEIELIHDLVNESSLG